MGGGNNSEDGQEGCVVSNAIGTYMHGPAFLKNPILADYLIKAALSKRYSTVDLAPLDDGSEDSAPGTPEDPAKPL